MEEEKKEAGCVSKKFYHYCEHKTGRLILLILAIAFIFYLGVCFGSYQNYNREGRGDRQFNFKQRDGRGMINNREEVGGCRFQNDDINGGCPRQNEIKTGQTAGGCMAPSQTVTPITSATTSVKAVTPLK